MTEQEKYPIEYSPCLFELPFKKLGKGWLSATIWVIIGTLSLAIFTLGLHCLDSSVDWFTTLYFVGGLGWVPAAMCGLSRAYYRMCQAIYPYLDEPKETMVQYYKNTADSIFGYLKNTINVFISIVIWILMLATVIINNATFSSEYTTASIFIYLFYIFVGIIFTCVPCAVIHFLRTLFKLRKFNLKKYALYQGAGDHLQKVHTNCILLIWEIIALLILLSIAMLKSPYHEALWVWLPVFGFVPLFLFIMNNKVIKSLINTALIREEAVLQEQINSILQVSSIERQNILLYALLGIQDKLREHTKSKSVVANAILLLFTILGGIGSIVAAGIAVFSNETVLQYIIHLWNTSI